MKNNKNDLKLIYPCVRGYSCTKAYIRPRSFFLSSVFLLLCYLSVFFLYISETRFPGISSASGGVIRAECQRFLPPGSLQQFSLSPSGFQRNPRSIPDFFLFHSSPPKS